MYHRVMETRKGGEQEVTHTAENKGTLYVKMFGRFSLYWEGREIFGGNKASDSQFSRLMQALLHFRENGISRSQLYDILFYDRKVSDPSHSLRVLIYNVKSKLKEMGLPDICFIQQEKDLFFWTSRIPVIEDAFEFEHLCRKIAECDETEPVQEYLRKAVETYTDEFLPLQASEIWVAQENRKYREMYNSCVHQLADYYRKNKLFEELEELGKTAAQCQPFYYWESLTMEALIAQNRIEKANQFYVDTENLYLNEMNQALSTDMVRMRDKIQNYSQQDSMHLMLDTIQKQLFTGCSMEPGGYLCSYPVFTGIYQVICRLDEQNNGRSILMLCSMSLKDGKQMTDLEASELSARLESSICSAARRCDVVTRYSQKQYLILVTDATSEICVNMQSRINSMFYAGTDKVRLNYHMQEAARKSYEETYEETHGHAS